MADPVLLAADDADLDLEDRVDGLHPGQQVFGDGEVLVERHGRAVPHVGLEDRVASGAHLGLGGGDERLYEARKGVLGAVVGVQRDRDRVVLRDLRHEAGHGERARSAVLHRVAGEVVGAARGDLDDAVRSRLREPCSTALIVCDDETLNAGYANPLAFALSSISAYWSGVATGMVTPSKRSRSTPHGR